MHRCPSTGTTGSLRAQWRSQSRRACTPSRSRCVAIPPRCFMASLTCPALQIKGTLLLKEIAEGGTVTYELCLSRVCLWSKDRDEGICPTSLPFSLALPATFNDGKNDFVRLVSYSALHGY